MPTMIAILPAMLELKVNVSTWDKDYIELQDRSGNTIWIAADDVDEVCALLRSLAKEIKRGRQ